LSKSPGISGLHYDHWRLFHPKVLQALTITLIHDFRNPDNSWELLRIHVKPLPKKARGRDIRPISLIETTLKLIEKMFLPKSRFEASAHISVLLDSGQECKLETQWLGFYMMSGKPKEPPNLFQWTWKAPTIVSPQRNSCNFWNRKDSPLNGYHVWAA